jgi:hypothetical protein
MIINLKKFKHLNNESPDLKDNFFDINKNSNFKKKIIIISGGSRNGNHLVTSILDGHPNLPYSPGEDRVLSQLFWEFLNNKKIITKELIKKNFFNYIKTLSGVNFDKWKKISLGKVNKKKWAGNHKQGYVPLIEYPNQNNFINYAEYNKKIKYNFKNSKKKNFDFIFQNYLDAFSHLSPENKDSKYDYMYNNSGLRRELYYLLKKKYKLKIIVPIRKFETYYPSKVIGRYAINDKKKNDEILNHKYLQDAWEHWKNKTVDYLVLKKIFPKNILIVKFEDLFKKNNIFYLKKICQFLEIKYSNTMLDHTSWRKKVKPNTSYGSTIKKDIKKKLTLSKKKIPHEYYSIYKEINKYSY